MREVRPVSAPSGAPEAQDEIASIEASAMRAWEKGQQEMLDGHTDKAIAWYEDSLRLDPGLVRNHLSLAAAFLARGEDERAANFLGCYVNAQPDHHVVRAHYAELLYRLKRPNAARAQYERFVADVQDREDLARQHLVHCHSRLMEIAENMQDEYNEHLHRGIGLYLLACRRAALPDPEDGELTTQGLLCKAASELALARLERPEQARPCWYLFEVWSHLAQHQPAMRWLRNAEDAATLSYLTPSEKRKLHLARQESLRESQRK
jgi:hypothetical protein